MMEKIVYPLKEEWTDLIKRPENQTADLERVCDLVFDEVKRNGDEALKKYTWHFDRVKLDDFTVSESEFQEAESKVCEDLKEAVREAKKNIVRFHALQKPSKIEYRDERGFCCWQEARAIRRVGLYIPGGSAPLFSTVLMLAVPAVLAGCEEIVMCTPPERDGNINPVVLWTASLCGVKRVYKVGGMQAIAAMTLGTPSIDRVDKIFGPGNRFVTAAKLRSERYGVAIDIPAGPSELMIVADDSARPDFIAADLLSQAEHGSDSQVFFLTDREGLPERVELELIRQLESLPRKELAARALENSKCVVLKTIQECMQLVNYYAPEHLMLCVRGYEQWLPEIKSAGSVFLGNYSPESAGDYASGTNHTLPTNGFARAYSGVNLDSFMKKITFQEITSEGLSVLSETIKIMAEYEQLWGHRNAITVRVNDKKR